MLPVLSSSTCQRSLFITIRLLFPTIFYHPNTTDTINKIIHLNVTFLIIGYFFLLPFNIVVKGSVIDQIRRAAFVRSPSRAKRLVSLLQRSVLWFASTRVILSVREQPGKRKTGSTKDKIKNSAILISLTKPTLSLTP